MICILSFERIFFLTYFVNNFVLQTRTEEVAKLPSSAGFSEEFNIMGLTIGTRGANIHQARKIEGVLNVELIGVNILVIFSEI